MDKIAMKIAWLMPKRIVFWCTLRLIAYATQGKYGNQIVPDLTAMDALERYRVDKLETK